MKNKLKSNGKREVFLGLSGNNCSAIINRSNVTDKDIKKLEHMETKEIICPICLEVVVKSKLLDCDHEFCIECFTNWNKNNHTCPTCRKPFREEPISDWL